MRPRIVVPLLVVATLAIGVENWLFFSRGRSPAPAAAPDGESADAESEDLAAESRAELGVRNQPPPLLSVSGLAALLASFDALRSPFLPEGTSDSEDPGHPTLAGLLIGQERQIAWLGSHARSEGELYEGWTVVRIEESRVVLERDGRRFSLWLEAPRADGAGNIDLDLALSLSSEEEKTP